MKADWFQLIKSGKQDLSLVARSLAIPLYIMLQQDIGLNSVTIVGCGPLGIKAMMVELICFRSLPEEKNSFTAATTEAPTNSHVATKNSDVYPSGPGHLL